MFANEAPQGTPSPLVPATGCTTGLRAHGMLRMEHSLPLPPDCPKELSAIARGFGAPRGVVPTGSGGCSTLPRRSRSFED